MFATIEQDSQGFPKRSREFVCIFVFVSKVGVGKCEAQQLDDVVDGKILYFNILFSVNLLRICSHALST